jgi:uncharacterized protein YjiS (DUF1127 family)
MSTQNIALALTTRGEQLQHRDGFLSHVISSIHNYLVATNARHELESLTDHELEDIGLTRSQIPYAVRIRENAESYRGL